MDYEIKELKGIKIQGTSTRTDNQEGMTAIPQLWEAFFKEDALSRIQNKTENTSLFAVYSDYESDENGKYSFTIGAEINSQNDSKKMKIINAPSGKYAVFTAPSKEKVIDAWQAVWQTNLNRAYIADFEQYDLTTGEVEIFVGLK